MRNVVSSSFIVVSGHRGQRVDRLLLAGLQTVAQPLTGRESHGFEFLGLGLGERPEPLTPVDVRLIQQSTYGVGETLAFTLLGLQAFINVFSEPDRFRPHSLCLCTQTQIARGRWYLKGVMKTCRPPESA